MYEVLSRYYDLFMDGENDRIEFAVNAVKGYYRGADVGCGSGAVTIALASEHDVVAIDSSEEMLMAASEKFKRMGLRIPVIKQSAEAFKLPREADFVTAICDVVNYLPSPEKFFSSAYGNLRSGGVLVFDISSESKLRKTIGDNVFTETKDDVTYIWENCLTPRYVDMTVTFFIPTGNGQYVKAVDCQRQYIYGKDYLTELLEKTGFKVQITDKGDRIFFVAKKEAG